ncbi:unnamed protein product, partial [Medioppia subpectinata]
MCTTTLALELAPHGIRVNSVSIGIVRSYEAHPDPVVIKAFENAAKYTPLGRVGTTADVAKGVVFLSSSDASFITGHSLVIDGGINLDWLLAIKNLTVRPTDVWICGYQKSGNTWLSGIVSLIMADGVVDRVKDEYIRERVPNIFTPTSLSKISGLKPQSVEWFEGIKYPRIINSHLD